MKNKLLMIILQTIVLFPNQELKLEFSNEISKKIIDESLKRRDGELVLVCPKNEDANVQNTRDVMPVGSFSKIKNYIELPNGNVRITLRGVRRVIIKSMNVLSGDLVEVTCSPIENPVYNLDEELAYSRKLKSLVSKYVGTDSRQSNSIIEILKNVSNLSKITDMIAAALDFNYRQKLKLFNETDYYKRAHMLLEMLSNEITSLELEEKIEEEVRNNFNKKEKDIIIKEKIKILSKEIGMIDDKRTECDTFLKRIESFKIDKKIKESMRLEVKRFENTLDSSPEYGSLLSHIEFVTSLPWNKSSKDENDIDKINEHLNDLHYGLNNAKERVLEYISLKKKNKEIPSPVLCLIGPPGTGKTTFARELAGATKREFVKITVGGLNDPAELIGHRRTYIGASAGKIMEGIRKCGVDNPIILIDEVDKIIKDYKGDPSSVLLEILDQNQNRTFMDNYVNEPFDLSNVLFILTANDEAKIPRALYDRLEVIEVASHTTFDKIEIVQHYTLPRLGSEYNFDYKMIKFPDEIIAKIIGECTKESGVRDLERHISTIIRKVLIEGLDKPITIRERELEKYLGIHKRVIEQSNISTPGVANVPAVTHGGGCILNVEVSIYQGIEKIISTGSLGKIMQESALVSLSYIKANSRIFKLDTKKLSGTLHIHALDGGTPKDGPSAGLAITVAIISELSGKIVPMDVAFTGEITLKGNILKVGGLKEKIISAYNTGIKKIYIPYSNEEDLAHLPKKVLKSISIVLVKTFTEVYTSIFE